MSLKKHRHRVHSSRDVAYRYPVRVKRQVPPAQGGITEIATCLCGAIRLTNLNHSYAEVGAWQDPAEAQS